ncbi:MAG: hypothetical protein JOZ57_05500, partial [Abitibacteriaceae bacterium]|nr:hypothetical protein [Abditibacteriaceae bacterium]
YGLRPDEAQRILSSHPAWAAEVDSQVSIPGSLAAWLRQKYDPQDDATAA